MTPPSTTTSSWAHWVAAGGLVTALIVVYFAAWRPGRVLFTQHVAHPALASIKTTRANAFEYRFTRGALRVRIGSSRPGLNAPDYHAPAGRDFLLGALLLAFLFPYRPYWLYLGGFHLAVGALFLGLMALGIAWGDGAFLLQRLLERYVVQALSLGAPLLALAYERGAFSPSTQNVSSPTSS